MGGVFLLFFGKTTYWFALSFLGGTLGLHLLKFHDVFYFDRELAR